MGSFAWALSLTALGGFFLSGVGGGLVYWLLIGWIGLVWLVHLWVTRRVRWSDRA